MAKLPKNLNVKQKLFCKNYIANGYNGAAAARQSGYKIGAARKTASDLLAKPDIKKYMHQTMEEIEQKLGISIEWKASMLKRCAERCMPDDEERRIRPTGMIQAIAELNKMQGHYAPNKIALSEDTSEEELIQKAREVANEARKEY